MIWLSIWSQRPAIRMSQRLLICPGSTVASGHCVAKIKWIPAAGPLDEYSGYTRRTYDDDAVKYYYKPRYTAAVTWTNAEGVTFTIRGAFEKDVLLKMAESVSAD